MIKVEFTRMWPGGPFNQSQITIISESNPGYPEEIYVDYSDVNKLIASLVKIRNKVNREKV